MRSCLVLPILLCCAACQAVPAHQVGTGTKSMPFNSRRAALELWQEGQRALHDGEIERAIYCCNTSLKEAPELKRNHLSLAAAYVEQGEDGRAVKQLKHYVKDQPNDLAARGYCAELLWRLKKYPEAREHFVQCDELAQEIDGDGLTQRIHCQCRLVRVAEFTDDEYAEHLHRGIGLYLLAKTRSDEPLEGARRSTEALLCRAASELTLARKLKPHEAQPSWYLHEVWSQLGQKQPALKSLREADEAAPLSKLSPAEKRELHIACLKEEIRKQID